MDGIQLSLFWKMSRDYSHRITERTLDWCCRASQKAKFQYLDLADGQTPEWLEANGLLYDGESLTLNIGESPNEENVSTLSSVLIPNAPTKYFLSRKAAEGIKRRANRRGKKLPELLEKALDFMIELDGDYSVIEDKMAEICGAFGISPNDSEGMKSDNPKSGFYEAKTSRTLDLNGGNPSCNQGGTAVVEKIYDSRGNGNGCVSLGVVGDHDSRISDYSNLVVESVHLDQEVVPYTMLIRSECEGGGKGPLVQKNKSATISTHNIQTLFQPIEIDRSGYNQGKNAQFDIGISENGIANTVVSKGPGAICYGVYPDEPNGVVGTIDAHYSAFPGARGGKERSMVYAAVDTRNAVESDVNGTLQAKSNGGFSCNTNIVVRILYIVRRLMPIECERLQGYDDNWTLIPPKKTWQHGEADIFRDVWKLDCEIKGKKNKRVPNDDKLLKWYNKLLNVDSTRYRQCGNSLAIPCANMVIRDIAEYLKSKKDNQNQKEEE